MQTRSQAKKLLEAGLNPLGDSPLQKSGDSPLPRLGDSPLQKSGDSPLPNTHTIPRQEFEVNIDFDEASRAWRENKVSIGNGSYKYVCCQRTITNKVCPRKCLPGEDYCRSHLRLGRSSK